MKKLLLSLGLLVVLTGIIFASREGDPKPKSERVGGSVGIVIYTGNYVWIVI